MRALVFDFLSRHARMLLDWTDLAERVIDGWEGATDHARDAAALEVIRTNLDAYPAPVDGIAATRGDAALP